MIPSSQIDAVQILFDFQTELCRNSAAFSVRETLSPFSMATLKSIFGGFYEAVPFFHNVVVLLGVSPFQFSCERVLAAVFPVATRDDVLVLTSKIQATHVLNACDLRTDGSEIDTLAARMRAIGTIAAAAEWIDNQTNANSYPPSTASAETGIDDRGRCPTVVAIDGRNSQFEPTHICDRAIGNSPGGISRLPARTSCDKR